MGQFVAAAQGAQHVAGLEAGRGAGRTRRHRQALDAHDQRLALDVVEAHVQVVRHAVLEVAVDEDLLHVLQAVEQALLQPRGLGDVFLHLGLGDAEGLAHAHDLVRGQRARTHAALVAATVHLGLEPHARLAAHVQRADALGTVGLVRRQTHQVDRQLRDVDLDLAGGLRGVDVEDHALLAADVAQRHHVLHHADLVVHEHHAREDGVGADRGLELLEVEQTVFLHVEVGDLETLALEFAHGVEHGLVLGLHRDQVLALALVELRRALEREVVRLGGARGPDDLARVGADQLGHVAARLLDRLFRFPAPGVAARRRVAEVLTQPGNHGVDHTRVDRRGGAVVEIDREMRSYVHGWLVLAWGLFLVAVRSLAAPAGRRV